MSVIDFLYRYIFRGVGIAWAIGALTALFAAAWTIYETHGHPAGAYEKPSSAHVHRSFKSERRPQ
jgi:peptidoglycan/LPS O-acetylase OafA/YrhL